MCGLFGFSDYGNNETSQLSDLTDVLAVESTVRGTDATGIAFVRDNKIEVQKDSQSAYSMDFKLPDGTRSVTGHTRHTTQGSEKHNYNNHPFKERTRKGNRFALCHNGIISNDMILRKTLSLPATKVETDTYIAVQLLEREKRLSFTSIARMAEQLTGSFSFSILDDQNNVYFVKGDSPLAVLHLTRLRMYVYASTEQILWKALSASILKELKDGCYDEVNVREGEILKISPDGMLSYGEFDFTPNSYDTCWWNYFNKPVTAVGADNEYISQLKSTAYIYGYTPDDIDHMLNSGFAPEEIEEALCSEDLGYLHA